MDNLKPKVMKQLRFVLNIKGDDLVDVLTFDEGRSRIDYEEGAVFQYLKYEGKENIEQKFIESLEHLAQDSEDIQVEVKVIIS